MTEALHILLMAIISDLFVIQTNGAGKYLQKLIDALADPTRRMFFCFPNNSKSKFYWGKKLFCTDLFFLRTLINKSPEIGSISILGNIPKKKKMLLQTKLQQKIQRMLWNTRECKHLFPCFLFLVSWVQYIMYLMPVYQ